MADEDDQTAQTASNPTEPSSIAFGPVARRIIASVVTPVFIVGVTTADIPASDSAAAPSKFPPFIASPISPAQTHNDPPEQDPRPAVTIMASPTNTASVAITMTVFLKPYQRD